MALARNPNPAIVLLLPLDGEANYDDFTLHGGIRLATEEKKFGNSSLAFDGSDDYVYIPDSDDWDIVGTEDFTIDFWVKHNDTAGYIQYVDQADERQNVGWYVYKTSDNRLGFHILNAYASTHDVVRAESAPDTLNDANWHHIAMCKVGTEFGVYLDGEQVAYDSGNNTYLWEYGVTLGIFMKNGSPLSYFNGYMDEIRMSHSNIFNANPDSSIADSIILTAAFFSLSLPGIRTVSMTCMIPLPA